MLTYDLEQRGEESLYGYLYQCISADVESGVIAAGEKLPSKRVLAKHLGVSLITVEGAYAQLVAEGYVRSEPRRGYFANAIARSVPVCGAGRPHKAREVGWRGELGAPDGAGVPSGSGAPGASAAPGALGSLAASGVIDLTGATVAADPFPFNAWARTLREVLAHEPERELLGATPPAGSERLREALAAHLRRFRGMDVQSGQIVVASGAQTLYNLLVQLLGRGCVFAVEDPGYPRLTSIYQANDVQVRHIPLDEGGISVSELAKSGASVAHLMPSHQFPTGFVTPISRRYELLGWATEEQGRYVIEDDYDCEFRLAGRPIPTMQSIDAAECVMYVNTFARSLGPAFRVAYMVLPPHLAERFQQELGFYSCTVSTMEQLTLARFIESGNFERHVNRMRSHYRTVRDGLLAALAASPLAACSQVEGADAGLHFVLRVQTCASEEAIASEALHRGVAVTPLSRFSCTASANALHDVAASGVGVLSSQGLPACCFVVSFASLDPSDAERAIGILAAAKEAAEKHVLEGQGGEE